MPTSVSMSDYILHSTTPLRPSLVLQSSWVPPLSMPPLSISCLLHLTASRASSKLQGAFDVSGLVCLSLLVPQLVHNYWLPVHVRKGVSRVMAQGCGQMCGLGRTGEGMGQGGMIAPQL